MLLLGVIQAQASGAVAAGSFDLLETQVLSSSAASVTFSGLSAYAADYQHLQLRIVARDARDGATSLIGARFNGDTASNYSRHDLRGNGSSVLSGASANSDYMAVGQSAAPTYSPASSFAPSVCDILDAFSSSKYKTTRSLSGNNANTFPELSLRSGSWRNLDAITSITLFEASGGTNFQIGSRFSIYGWKAA